VKGKHCGCIAGAYDRRPSQKFKLIIVSCSLGIVVEALPTLLTQPLRINHALEKDTGTILGVPCPLIERLLNGKAGVETDARFHRDQPLGR
jgi:hypothetical protein